MSDRHDLLGWGTHNPCHDCPSIKCGNPDCDWMIVLPPTDAVPRVARSLDDLRDGQVVAWIEPTEGWMLSDVDLGNWDFTGTEVILADPPEPDFLVPRAVMERLREALRQDDQHFLSPHELLDASRAVVDAATEVEDR